MAKLQDSFAVIVEDLKTSWYFRIWAAVWVICAVTVFASVIVLGAKATASSDDKSWTVWIEEKDYQYYPQFQFEGESGKFFTEMVCTTTTGVNIQAVACSEEQNCYFFDATRVKATQSTNSILCKANATVTEESNQMITLSVLSNDNDVVQGVVSIAPTDQAWVLLEKNIKDPSGGDETDIWTTQLSYQTTLATTGAYTINIKFGSFDVYHYEETTLYDRWASVCDIGGFGFFMYLLHVMFMATVNVFLDNDSHWLGGSAKKDYQNF